MKDDESTLNCTQVFVVTACQPRALEVVIAGQSYLLGPGDHFFVPQVSSIRPLLHRRTTLLRNACPSSSSRLSHREPFAFLATPSSSRRARTTGW